MYIVHEQKIAKNAVNFQSLYYKPCTAAKNGRDYFTALQTSLLTELYERNHYPSFGEMKRISIILGMDVKKVASWMRFKRCKVGQGKKSSGT